MNDSDSAPIFFFDNDDPQMQAAYAKAQATFRYLWRELSWEYRRIVPALDFACVKTPFSDPDGETDEDGRPQVEQMWISEVEFDGEQITGTLINSPNWLTSVAEGDEVTIPLSAVTDWMYAINSKAYGGYTVNLMRQRMDPHELGEHDSAWGLEFGDPDVIDLVPAWEEGGESDPAADHPMDVNVSEAVRGQLQDDPELLNGSDDDGWTFLHHFALGGANNCIRVLLEEGADPNVKTNQGKTPLDFAQMLGWESVAQLLRERGAQSG
jgi:uncharacterized protein YegJ (DUF2314 family)